MYSTVSHMIWLTVTMLSKGMSPEVFSPTKFLRHYFNEISRKLTRINIKTFSIIY
uniref:Uncharacterized protein n=1 Tax=Lepeophtheirus salmonis TaxID=72036 RepID=A0A0K2VD33_LEPSM